MTHCNTAGEIKQDLVENKGVVSVLLLIFIKLKGFVFSFSTVNYAGSVLFPNFLIARHLVLQVYRGTI